MVRFFLLGAVATAATLLPAGALAAYCGPTSDVAAVQTLAVKHALNDRTRVEYISVVGEYAIAALEFKGEEILYFTKHNGTWAISGANGQAPPMPASVRHQFQMIEATIPHPCANPAFINHPSGS